MSAPRVRSGGGPGVRRLTLSMLSAGTDPVPLTPARRTRPLSRASANGARDLRVPCGALACTSFALGRTIAIPATKCTKRAGVVHVASTGSEVTIRRTEPGAPGESDGLGPGGGLELGQAGRRPGPASQAPDAVSPPSGTSPAGRVRLRFRR